ncbi:putative leucine-rich repeat domain superfamily [Septoria linicola]|nr:putative leucine-rich repeat domain superfamily [Septoria linicola]
MVKHITIDQWDLNLMQSLDRWWKDKLSRIGFGQKLVAALVQKAEAGIEDAQVALLLTLASIRFGDTSLTVGIQNFEPLLRLPTLKRLTLHRIVGDSSIFTHMPQLQELCLWRCDLDKSTYEALKPCVNLRSLRIIWPGIETDYMKNVYPLDTVINYEHVSTFITTHLPKLEHLVLDPREASSMFGKSCKQLGSLDLSFMAHLKELAVEAQALWHQHVTNDLSSHKINVPLPRLSAILPPSRNKLAILVNHCGGAWTRAESQTRWSRNPRLIVNDCMAYLINAPSSLSSVHLDWPAYQVDFLFSRRQELLSRLGLSYKQVVSDPQVARASPVVGVTTPKEQRDKVLNIFRPWLASSKGCSTLVIGKNGRADEGGDLSKWRILIEEEVQNASTFFHF